MIEKRGKRKEESVPFSLIAFLFSLSVRRGFRS